MKQIKIYLLFFSIIVMMISELNGQVNGSYDDILHVSKIDSIIYIKNNITYKNTISYNTENKISLRFIEKFDTLNNKWINFSKQSYSYDDSNNTVLDLTENWDSTGWVIYRKEVNEYNSQGERTLNLSEYYYSYRTTIYKTNRNFDVNGNETLYLFENIDDGEISSSYRYLRSFDIFGNETLVTYENLKNGKLEYDYRITRTFDSKGNISSYTYEKFNEGLSEFVRKDTYTYDYSNNSGLKLTQKWEDNKWKNQNRQSHIFDEKMNIVSQIYELWKDDNHWEYNSNDSSTYNNNDLLISKVRKYWNGNNWYNSFRYYWTYNDSGDEILYKEEKASGATSNDSLTQWTVKKRKLTDYNSNNKLTSYLYEILINNDWMLIENKTISYQQNGDMSYNLQEKYNSDGTLDIRTFQTWNFNIEGKVTNYSYERKKDTSSFSAFRTIREYDDNGNMKLLRDEEWDAGSFIIERQYEYIFDDDNNLISGLSKRWYNDSLYVSSGAFRFLDTLDNTTFLHAESFQNYYNKIVTKVDSENTLHPKYSLSQNYPNPFNPSTTINYYIPSVRNANGKIENVTLKVYDILGREVVTLVNQKQIAGSYEVDFNAGELSSGIYFYRLHVGDFIKTKKLTLMK